MASVYPLLFLALLYGQWLLSWLVLGHPPRPSLDDPADIAGARWLYPITALVLTAFPVAAGAVLVLNALELRKGGFQWRRLLIRTALIACAWAGTVALLRWDPGLVMYWWLD